MARSIPPELVAPEDAAVRADELASRIRHENLMAFVAITVAIELPLLAMLVVAAVLGFSRTMLTIGFLVFLGLFFALMIYWDRRRLAPLERQKRAMERRAGEDGREEEERRQPRETNH